MRMTLSSAGRTLAALSLVVCGFSAASKPAVDAAGPPPIQASEAKSLYDGIKSFALTGGSAEVSNLTLKRDRVEMTFNGTFYFAAPANGKVTGAVFVGDGRI